MRNELLDLYNEAIASNATKDAVYAYREARDRIGPQIVMEEVLDNDALRARLAEVEAQRDGLRRAVKLAIELDVAGVFDHMEILKNALSKLGDHDGK